MTVNLVLDALLQRLEATVVVLVHGEGIHLGDTCKHAGDERFIHVTAIPILAVHLQPSPCLIDQVNGLVGQVSVGNMASAARNCKFQRIIVIGYSMKLLIALLEHLHNLQRLVDARLLDGHLLETAHQAAVAHDVAVIFLIGGRPDEAHSPTLQIGFQQVAGIHRAFARLPGPHDVVYLVDVEDGSFLGCDAFHHRLEPFLKITTELCAGNQRAQVQLVDLNITQGLGNVSVLDALCQSIDDAGLAHARFTDVQRVVLILATQNLNSAVQFHFTPDEGVVVCQMVIDAEHIVTPAARYSIVANWLHFFHFIGFHLVILIRRVRIILAQRLKEITLVFIADEQVQAICSIRILQVHHLMNQVIDIDHPDFSIVTKHYHGSHQLLILVGISDDWLGLIFRVALHASDAFPQLLYDIIN